MTKTFLLSILIIFACADSAFADAYYTALEAASCNVNSIVAGTGGKIFVAIAIGAIGVMFFTGKVSLKVLIGSVIAIAAMFGAPSIVSAVSGRGAYDCVSDTPFDVQPPIPPKNSSCFSAGEGSGSLTMKSPSGKPWVSVAFASYGTPTSCKTGTCNSSLSVSRIAAACIGKTTCTVPVTNSTFSDPCPGVPKRLNVILNYYN